MNDYSLYAIERDDVISTFAAARADAWRLLRRLALPARINESSGGIIKRALVLDVETTGK